MWGGQEDGLLYNLSWKLRACDELACGWLNLKQRCTTTLLMKTCFHIIGVWEVNWTRSKLLCIMYIQLNALLLVSWEETINGSEWLLISLLSMVWGAKPRTSVKVDLGSFIRHCWWRWVSLVGVTWEISGMVYTPGSSGAAWISGVEWRDIVRRIMASDLVLPLWYPLMM